MAIVNYKKVDTLYKRVHGNLLIKNIGWLYLLQISVYVFPLLTIPYLARTLGLEIYGFIAIGISITQYVNIITDWGFNISLVPKVVENRNNKVALGEILANVLMIKLILFVAIWIIIFWGLLFVKFDVRFCKIITSSLLLTLSNSLMPTWFFQGIEEMKQMTIVNWICRLSFSLLIFIFIKSENDYELVLFLQGIGALVGVIYMFGVVFFRNRYPIMKPQFKQMKSYLKESSSYFFSRVFVSLYTASNAIVLGIFSDFQLVGAYAVAEKIYQAMQSFYSPIAQAIYPHIARGKDLTSFKKIFRWCVVVNTSVIMLLIFFANAIYIMVAGVSNDAGILTLQIFLLVSIFVVPSILIGYPLLGALGFGQDVNQSVFFGALVYMTCLVALAMGRYIEPVTVAFSILAVEVTVLIARVTSLKKRCSYNPFAIHYEH